ADAGTISFSAGKFTVSGDHTYAEESASDHAGSFPSYDITVTISHDTADDAVVHSSATVSDPAVVAIGGFVINTVEGVDTGAQTVATFTDPGGAEAVGDYTASINWGDGTAASAGTITFDSGVFTVQGNHTYATGLGLPDEFGNSFCDGVPPSFHKAITVTITHEDAPTSQAVSDAKISIPPGSAHQASDGTLIIVGTIANDTIVVNTGGGLSKKNIVTVELNSVPIGSFAMGAGARIIAAGIGGNDDIQIASGVLFETLLYGGPGD